MATLPLLEVRDWSVDFPTDEGTALRVVDGISFKINPNETLAIVGESGSGKSITALSLMGLLPPAARPGNGQILLHSSDTATPTIVLTDLSPAEHRRQLGRRLAMIFQEPMTALNPVLRCGDQVLEAVQLHRPELTSAATTTEVLRLFGQVGLPNSERIFSAYPHELSGGQQQRVMIAMALSGRPSLLIADEPTTALDVTTQRTILDLIESLKREFRMAVLFITHDLGVVADIADRVLVMRSGQVVERGETAHLFSAPAHPYTRGLLACRPPLRRRLHRLPLITDFLSESSSTGPLGGTAFSEEEERRRLRDLDGQSSLLRVENVHVWFPLRRGRWRRQPEYLQAVRGVDLHVRRGETLGIVGESGSGKTTLGRAILGLQSLHKGAVYFDGVDPHCADSATLARFRQRAQIIFQDPYSSLNPTQSVGAAIGEALLFHRLVPNRAAAKEHTVSLLERVGLTADHRDRFPHEFSGGQRQRICIARALATQPEFLVCDECVSALDVSVQAQIINLLLDLQEQYQLTYIFISHDLAVIRQVSDWVAVMQRGEIVEYGATLDVLTAPQTSYTRALLNATLGD